MVSNSWVFLNGRWITLEAASLPITDRGILFGDGVYEMIAVYKGHCRALNNHLDRLEQSLNGILLRSPLSKESWKQAIYDCLKKNNLDHRDAAIYIQVTRGNSNPRDFDFSEEASAHYFIQARAFDFADIDELKQGCKVISHEDIRRANCFIKSTCLQTSALLKHQAVQAGAQECILHRDGYLTEGSASNVFMIKDDVIYTPPLTRSILPGVTRQLVIELCRELQITIQEKPIQFKDLYSADNLFITSTTRTIKPVNQLDDTMIGHGETGPICLKLMNAYLKKMENWHEPR
jgi:D-alanine transaminase